MKTRVDQRGQETLESRKIWKTKLMGTLVQFYNLVQLTRLQQLGDRQFLSRQRKQKNDRDLSVRTFLKEIAPSELS